MKNSNSRISRDVTKSLLRLLFSLFLTYLLSVNELFCSPRMVFILSTKTTNHFELYLKNFRFSNFFPMLSRKGNAKIKRFFLSAKFQGKIFVIFSKNFTSQRCQSSTGSVKPVALSKAAAKISQLFNFAKASVKNIYFFWTIPLDILGFLSKWMQM